jgi:hypothetical protein
VDTRLRAVLRGDDARLGQLEMKMDSALRPRDIQARIRSGETPEQVAAAAQTTVEGIMAFASPVLAERAHVARTAQRASVRRRPGDSSSAGRTLGDAAELFFAEHQLHDEDVEWDAWRRPDGRWALVAQYAVEGRPRTAEFSHDLPGRYVVAENDEARVLIGEMSAPSSRTASGPRSSSARRLSSVPHQDELPLGDDAIELVRDHDTAQDTVPDTTPDTTPATAPATAAQDPTQDDDTAPIPGLGDDTGADRGDADWMVADGAAPVPEPVGDDQQLEGSEDRAEPLEVGDHPEAPSEEAPLPVTDANDLEAPDQEVPDDEHADQDREQDQGQDAEQDGSAAEGRAARRKGRSSVPTWDEIMFGGGKFD